MLTIIFTACLLATGTCSEQTATAITDGSAEFACMFGAQQYVAQWQVTHPEYRVKGGYRCLKPGVEVSKS